MIYPENHQPFSTPVCLFLLMLQATLMHWFAQELRGQNTKPPLRVAAEWEPAIGVMIGWPLVLPEPLVVDLSKNEKLFVVLETIEDKHAAAEKLAQLNVADDQVEFVVGSKENPNGPSEIPESGNNNKGDTNSDIAASEASDEKATDSAENDLYEKIHIWTRDWGPFAGFSDRENYHLIDPIFADYPLSKLPCNSELFYFPGARKKDWNFDETASLGAKLGLSVKKADAWFVGGNLMFDGNGTAMSTCVSLTENKSHGISPAQFTDVAEKTFGITKYHIIPNFEDLGIQHIDCFLKFLSEDQILIARPPTDSKLFPRYQEIVGQIAKLKNSQGQTYRIYRINCGRIKNAMENIGSEEMAANETLSELDMEGIAAYTNSLILNKNIYVPLYGIHTDQAALETWRLVMPGYEVTGYVFTEETGSKIPWQSFDALHCRTRAVWDPDMLYMTHRAPRSAIRNQGQVQLDVRIVDYSGVGLTNAELFLNWRPSGQVNWIQSELTPASDDDKYSAKVDLRSTNRIEYYFSAASGSGRKETQPRTAPQNCYSVEIR